METGILRLFSVFRGYKWIYLALSALSIALIADSSFFRIYSISTIALDIQTIRYIFFLTTACVLILVEYPIMIFIKNNTKEIKSERSKSITHLYKIVSIVQFCLSGLFVLVILEVLIERYYGLTEILAITTLSYILATMMMILLAKNFFSSYTWNKNVLILMYGLSAVTVAANFTTALLFVGDVF